MSVKTNWAPYEPKVERAELLGRAELYEAKVVELLRKFLI
jgi:hypothetical protein